MVEENVYLVMSGYGRDESVPYAWRNVRHVFRGCLWYIQVVNVWLLECYIHKKTCSIYGTRLSGS